MITVRANAKINLTLEIVGHLPGGYHGLSTLYQQIDLGDNIGIEAIECGIELHSSDPQLPEDEQNLAFRAARLLQSGAGEESRPGIRLRLDKVVPIGAGLGGGSSDAAAVLASLRPLLVPSLTDDELEARAASLGADVAFFLRGGRALGTGFGERLTSLPDQPILHLVVIKPPVSVSTAWAYAQWDRMLEERGPGSARPGDDFSAGEVPVAGPHTRKMMAALATQDLAAIAASLHNDLEKVVLPAFPPIAGAREALRKTGALGVLMSGSGSACFGIFPGEKEAARAAGNLAGWVEGQVFAVRSMPRISRIGSNTSAENRSAGRIG